VWRLGVHDHVHPVGGDDFGPDDPGTSRIRPSRQGGFLWGFPAGRVWLAYRDVLNRRFRSMRTSPSDPPNQIAQPAKQGPVHPRSIGKTTGNGTFGARAGTSACQLAGSMLISINAAVLAFAITIAVQVEDDGSASGETVEVCAPLPVAG